MISIAGSGRWGAPIKRSYTSGAACSLKRQWFVDRATRAALVNHSPPPTEETPMATTSGTDALRNVPLFAALSESDLSSLAAELSEAAYPPGFRIFEAGD